ncbi:hypothetical protein MKW98_018913, partial [Papaver atlanticum]
TNFQIVSIASTSVNPVEISQHSNTASAVTVSFCSSKRMFIYLKNTFGQLKRAKESLFWM